MMRQPMPQPPPVDNAGEQGAGAGAVPPLDPQEIANETQKPVQQVEADIRRTGATTKEELYPEIYGGQEGAPGGIDPALAQVGGRYEQDPQAAPATPPASAGLAPPDGDGDEPPQRIAARQAMSGEAPPPPQPQMDEGATLGVMAAAKKPFNPHERARKMGHRRF